MEQRTEEWFAARVGKVTASNVDNVIVKVKNGESMYKRKYRTQLITEQLTGKPVKIQAPTMTPLCFKATLNPLLKVTEILER